MTYKEGGELVQKREGGEVDEWWMVESSVQGSDIS